MKEIFHTKLDAYSSALSVKCPSKYLTTAETHDKVLNVTILDFILAKNPLSPPSIPFSYPMKRGRKRKNTKKSISKKRNLEYVCKSIDARNEFMSSISLYK